MAIRLSVLSVNSEDYRDFNPSVINLFYSLVKYLTSNLEW
jgi:hypothetical protein